MARVTIKKVNYGRKAPVRSVGSRIWTQPHRNKPVPVKDSKLPKAAEKQTTLEAKDANKVKRGGAKSDHEPAGVNVKRQRAWSKR
ncbi:hypothetical protein [Parasutterella muris]|uniref:hypothetical protein n=1 Tax=Parasutterella muris TaxID=2565572 RepID=UPI00203FE3D6|nr:hypothetical protein [Parasutterella muris]